MLDKFFGLFSYDIGIDLGTANTLVYVRNKGIVINEPSIVALNRKTDQVLAIGTEAKRMLGRTPAHIVAVRPLVEGVINNFEITEEMISYFIRKVHSDRFSLFSKPKVVIGIPSDITEVERRAVRDASQNSGALVTYLVEEPMAAAIGVGLPVQDPIGSMIVDIGGGTSDVAVISLGGIVTSINLRVAGDKLNDDIINYARDEFKILLGERTAEDVKIAIGSAYKADSLQESTIRGRDIISGLPREVVVTSSDIKEALSKSLRVLAEAVKEVIEATPPELVSDIMQRGIVITGGGALLRDIDKFIEKETKIPVRIADDPFTAVVRGCGIILEDMEHLKDVFIKDEIDIVPR
ncbi:MAG: rod shape-determining protein [Candidatus Niyogibacteria bacterium CG10_big_fil_rev_8_21_14_0_10_42_19]|uniref:Cell shape-determining protein MreB n=1 Tax=Candidatus Niyogibacteria bacterium CG10_big_fil_rev_8_21_14_0_10_42_19 TaxID=1974725 RepID=A0A2H0TFS5_9BACT|nr:MAG: rod shape-determining protein [Candidatus Niyogibacteria bacterium CG10_big_fil_rev_8_21_14_0_10_42_19]